MATGLRCAAQRLQTLPTLRSLGVPQAALRLPFARGMSACQRQVAARAAAQPVAAAAGAAASVAARPAAQRLAVQREGSSKVSSSQGIRRLHTTRMLASSSSAQAGPPPAARRLILTDAMAILYRSHYAFSAEHRLRNSAGEDTTVVFGFLSTLLNLLELEPPPTHFAVVFDAPGKTFRHELYEGYKGQRQACPAEVTEAIPRLQRLLRAMAIPYIQVPGVEADDVIGTLACRAVHEGLAVAVASPDKDFMQLLRPGILLLRPPKKAAPGERVSKYALVPYNAADFEAEYGLQPPQFVDVLALAGDASDNIPGVAGIGPKTAVSLLKQHSTLEEVLEHAPEVKPKKASTMLSTPEGKAAARLSQQLVRIETELDVPPVREPLEQLRLQLPADRGADVLRQFQSLEFAKHAARVQALWQGPLYTSQV